MKLSWFEKLKNIGQILQNDVESLLLEVFFASIVGLLCALVKWDFWLVVLIPSGVAIFLGILSLLDAILQTFFPSDDTPKIEKP